MLDELLLPQVHKGGDRLIFQVLEQFQREAFPKATVCGGKLGLKGSP